MQPFFDGNLHAQTAKRVIDWAPHKTVAIIKKLMLKFNIFTIT